MKKDKVKKIKEENLNKMEKKRCEDFLKGKNCELCEQIFDDLLNKNPVNVLNCLFIILSYYVGLLTN